MTMLAASQLGVGKACVYVLRTLGDAFCPAWATEPARSRRFEWARRKKFAPNEIRPDPRERTRTDAEKGALSSKCRRKQSFHRLEFIHIPKSESNGLRAHAPRACRASTPALRL